MTIFLPKWDRLASRTPLFYISNDAKSVTLEQIVFSCNKRCDRENLIAQLKSGVHANQIAQPSGREGTS